MVQPITSLRPAQVQHPILVLHHDDLDGWCGAWLLSRAFERSRMTFQAVQYGDPAPSDDALRGHRTLLIVDFSFPRQVLERLAALMGENHIGVFDHHITAEEHLRGLPYAAFDLNQSGCSLVYRWLHSSPVTQRPLLDYQVASAAIHVEDRDLWRFSDHRTRPYCEWLNTLPKDIKAWDAITATPYQEILRMGDAIIRYRDNLVERASMESVPVEFAGYTVPAVNASNLVSEVAHAILEREPSWPFVIVWQAIGNSVLVHLRSGEGGVDVGELAKRFGGGGHKRAAGFLVRMDNPVVSAILEQHDMEEA